MSSVQQVESSIRELSESELVEFRKWFAQYDATAWDDQFEQDVAAGRLDTLADAAAIDLRNGEMTYRGVISHGSVVLKDNPQLPEGTVVEVRPVVSSALNLAGHEACGIWVNRTDLQDSSQFAQTLRWQVESRK